MNLVFYNPEDGSEIYSNSSYLKKLNYNLLIQLDGIMKPKVF